MEVSPVPGQETVTAAPTAQETIESVIRGQRRMKGTIVSVEPGKCRVAGELGEFPFSVSAVKENKRFPGREARAGDRCDFKLSDTNPVKATSIRVIVPKVELQTSQKTEGSGSDYTTSVSATVTSINPRCTTGPIASSQGGSVTASHANCVTASSLGVPHHSGEGGSGIDDLCNGLQRMGSASGSLFSI